MNSKELDDLRKLGNAMRQERHYTAAGYIERAAAHIAAQDARIFADAQTIATLRADLAKAVERVEAVVTALSLSEERGYGSSAKRIAQSLIKELRP